MTKLNFRSVFGKLPFVIFLLAVVLPVIYTFVSAFFDVNAIKDITSDTLYLLIRSIALAFSVAVLATIAGTALGFILYKTNVAFRGFFKIALLVPLFISPYILAVAWQDFFSLVFNDINIISSYAGVVFVLTIVFTPLSMLITGSALSNINSHLEESGLLITNSRNVIFKITFPLIKPALITSFVLVFIFSISEFSVPAYFGIKVFTTEIFTQFSAFYNHSLATVQSVLLVAVCLLLLFTESKYIAEAPFISVDSKGSDKKNYNLEVVKWRMLLLLAGFLIVTVVVPFAVLFIQAFKGGAGKFIKAFQLLKPTFGNSFGLASVGAALIVFFGLAAALSSAGKTKSRRTNIFDWFLLFVFAIPSTILGISLIKFYNHPLLDFIYSGYIIILIGYAGKFSFISAKLIGNAVKQIPVSLDEAAQIQGIRYSARLFKILIPLVLPSLFAAFMIGFIFSLGEMGTTIMVYPPGTEIMPIKMFTIMANASQELVGSLSLIVFSITLLAITIFYFIVKPVYKNYNFQND